jgi:ATP-dependent DNA helicase RecG
LPRPLKSVHQQPEFERQEAAVLTLLQNQEEIAVKDVMSYLNTSRATAGRLLTKLVEQGLLLRVGRGPATRYQKFN